MKVLLIYGDPRVDTYGGVEVHSTNLTRSLSEMSDMMIEVLTYGDMGEDDSQAVRYHRLMRLTRSSILNIIYPLVLICDVFRILFVARRVKPDLIHFQGTHPVFCLAAMVCRKWYPTVLTVHGILREEVKHGEKGEGRPRASLLGVLSVAIEGLCMSKLDNVVVLFPDMGRYLGLSIPLSDKRLFAIPNGINMGDVTGVVAFEDSRPKTILFIGHLIKRKGVETLLRSIAAVKAKIPDISLRIIGSGPLQEKLEKTVVSLGIEDNVCFLGFIRGRLKYSYLKSSDVLVVPSEWESLPIVILEAMGCGTPVIASDVGGIRELVSDGVNGFLVSPGDPDALTERILTVLENKALRDSMGRENLRRCQAFSWDRIAARTTLAYTGILEGRKASS